MTMNARRVATPELIGDSGVATRRGFARLADQALKRLAKLTCRYAAESALLFYHYLCLNSNQPSRGDDA
jgi:hypothetical protein